VGAEIVPGITCLQDAYATVHLRVLKHVYTGGCPRDMSSCPKGWARYEACFHATSLQFMKAIACRAEHMMVSVRNCI
jgi:hypothetical protein